MQVKSIAECSKGSILQYFRPLLSYHFPFRPLFCLFLSSPLRQVLLYIKTRRLLHWYWHILSQYPLICQLVQHQLYNSTLVISSEPIWTMSNSFIYFILYFLFDALCPCQQFSVMSGRVPVFLDLTTTKQWIVSCSMTQHNDSVGDGSQASNLSIPNLTLSQLSPCPPQLYFKGLWALL